MTRRLQKNRPKLLAPVHLSEIDAHNCRCQFRAFQRELQILGTKKFEIGSVVEKLQPFEISRFSKNAQFCRRGFYVFPWFALLSLSCRLILNGPYLMKRSRETHKLHTKLKKGVSNA